MIVQENITGGPPGRLAGPGRPKDLAKREVILAAARALFFTKGVEGVGIEEIARRANVSKMTVYSRFRDKAAILSAIVSAEAIRMTAAVDLLPGDMRNLEQRLAAFGTALLTFLTSAEMLAFERLIVAQAIRHPDLANAMLEAGPRFGHQKLAQHLAAATAQGELAIKEPIIAAEQLTALWKGNLYLECQLGVRPAPTSAEIDRHVRESVAMFMRSYRPMASP